MPSLRGIVLITGANGDLGSAFTSNLISSPCTTSYRGIRIYTVRNPSTASTYILKTICSKALSTSTTTTQSKFKIIPLDLSSPASMRGIAAPSTPK